ncbi:hypothetical protein A1O1_08578 [Capronia coronata CBS 617.96]|uniref:Uncharacterized protein n=1 Tax=Capronia coronata CBS 617.96 TaxID=1182541 RepID=W9XJS5_9EURO|nr:uncharacterized protein A1O1_08578 [Capronia coronata CBS 617.96]EXJ80433.1 hypothetical protein A1O1_08578 [Capronia coronata CBS 617.96]
MSIPTFSFEMPEYAKGTGEQRGSYLSSFARWFQLKKYQYEVTFSLYMLTSTEKFIFNLILFILVSLLVTAASFYLPNHIAVIYNRIYYYVNGEFAYATATAGGKAVSYMTDGLAMNSGTPALVTSTAQVMGDSAAAALRDL